MVPDWLHLLAVVSLVLAGLCALVIAADEFRHPQKMWIMSAVWPITALYFGPIGLWAYFAIGRKSSMSIRGRNRTRRTSRKTR
jgi:hypothetical protein